MNFISIDPGPHTGITLWKGKELRYATVPSAYKKIIHELTCFIEEDSTDFVLCEAFVGNTKTTDDKATVELIGFIRGWCQYCNVPFKTQAPTVRKGYIQFAKTLPELQTVNAGVRRHAVDSAAHALRYLHKEVKLWIPTVQIEE